MASEVSMMDDASKKEKVVIPKIENAKKEINDILICFSNPEYAQNNEDGLQEVYKKIEEYIEKDKNRILYSTVSNYIFSLEDESRESLQMFLDKLASSVLSNDKQKNTDTGKAVLKLWDHANLAISQELYVKKKNVDTVDAMRKLENQMNNTYYQVSSLSNKYDGLTTQLISIVSIFTAISFVVFGGIASFQNIFSNIEYVSLTKILIVGCVWGFATINLLYLFIYYMAKLTGKNIKTNYSFDAKLFQRHPYIVCINMFLLTIFIISLWIKILEASFGVDFFISIIDKNIVFAVLGSVFVCAVILLLWFVLLKKKKEKINHIVGKNYPSPPTCGIIPTPAE